MLNRPAPATACGKSGADNIKKSVADKTPKQTHTVARSNHQATSDPH